MTGDNSYPDSWAIARLGSIADVQLGKMLDRSRTRGESYPYLRNINVRWGRIDTSDLLEMPFQEHEVARYAVAPGDVLVCEGGEPGRSAVWRSESANLKYQKALHRVRTDGLLIPEWLAYHLRRDAAVGSLTRYFTGSTINHLTREALCAYEVRVAPTDEQKRVVSALDSYLSRLDEVSATLERLQRNLKRYRASVLKAAVEGRLVPTEAELARQEGRDFEPADVLLQRILDERKARWIEDAAEKARARAESKAKKAGKPWSKSDDEAALEKGRKAAAKKYQPPEPPDTSERSKLPEGWVWTRLDQLLATGLSNGRSVPTADAGFPVLRLTALNGSRIDLGERKTGRWTREDAEAHLVSGGDILVARGNGSIRLVGWGGLVDADPDDVAFPDTMIRIRLVPGEIVPEFFVAIWNSRLVRDQLERRARTTAGIYKVNQAILESIALPLPPLQEQRRLVAEIGRHETITDATVRTAEVNGLRADRLRQSILKWAFEGRLVDQDPNNEPASVLLERIAAEREKAEANGGKKKRRTKSRKKKTA